MRVAVIGAGATGLCAARHLRELMFHADNQQPFVTKLVVYEQTEHVSGTWVYTEHTGLDKHRLPIHSSMYRDMRTNLPKEVMQFPDFPFVTKNSTQSFVSHRVVREYLERYARHFDLTQFIRFNQHVVECRKQSDGSWYVTARDLTTRLNATEHYDSVFVCNGHYFKPHVLNTEPYNCLVTHSHNYRSPEIFEGMSVACVGAGPSGTDIAIELANVCPKVYLCHNHTRINAKLPSNVRQTSGIQQFHSDHITLSDGAEIRPDAIMLCTELDRSGYEYSFPFLEPGLVSIVNNRVTPLYQHLVHIEHPELFFVGLCGKICPFPNFDLQVRFACAMLTDSLPKQINKQEMYDWQEQDFDYRIKELGWKPKHAHFLGSLQWSYMSELCRIGGFPNPVPPVAERLYKAVHNQRLTDLTEYKNAEFELIDDEQFRQTRGIEVLNTVDMPDVPVPQ